MSNAEDFRVYRRKQNSTELRPYFEGEPMDGILVEAEDIKAGSPKYGDMIARNPKNHDDKWLVTLEHFIENFEPV